MKGITDGRYWPKRHTKTNGQTSKISGRDPELNVGELFIEKSQKLRASLNHILCQYTGIYT